MHEGDDAGCCVGASRCIGAEKGFNARARPSTSRTGTDDEADASGVAAAVAGAAVEAAREREVIAEGDDAVLQCVGAEKGANAREGTSAAADADDTEDEDTKAGEEGLGADAGENTCVDAGVKDLAVRFQAHVAGGGEDAAAEPEDDIVHGACGWAAPGTSTPALGRRPRRMRGTAEP